jgi:ribosome-associated protein
MEEKMTSKDMAEQLVALLHKKGANQINMYFVGEESSLTDYHIIASARSTTHARAMADDLDYEMSEIGIEKRAIEGKDGGAWVLLDFYSVIVHIFEPSQREFYNLERLQKQTSFVDISGIIAALDEEH